MSKLVSEGKLSRRGFLASVAAAGALYGCSGGDGDTYVIPNGSGGETDIVIPADEKVYPTSLGTNCGGRCMIRAHVQGGVIKRFSSDERSDIERDPVADPHKRACMKCRGKRSEIYKTDRLLYPLKQTSYRGDPDGFVRIPWKQAFDEIAAKLKEITDTPYPGVAPYTDPHFSDPSVAPKWGKATIFCAGGSTTASVFSHLRNFINAMGARMEYRLHALSYPGTHHVDRLTVSSDMSLVVVNANRNRDMLNCDRLVLWGYNPGDSIQGNNSINRLQEARKKGIPMTVIDPQISRTSMMLGCKHLGLIGGTDTALVFAILYHLITKQLAEADINNGKWLDFAFIKKAVHGFFDLPNPTTADFYTYTQGVGYPSNDPRVPYPPIPGRPPFRAPTTDAQAAHDYRVPAGASLSAYIMGNDTALVTANINYAASVYPATIGYNVNSAADAPDGTEDPLYRKRVPIYGQIPKTPEWAEMITGIPAADIKELAEQMGGTERLGILCGWGSNRTCESEQAPWAVNTLGAVLGCFGENGKFWGSTHMISGLSSTGLGYATPALDAAKAAVSKDVDNTVLNFNRMNRSKMSFTNTGWLVNNNYTTAVFDYSNATTIQMSNWFDMAMCGGTGKSLWNNPEVKYGTPVKAAFMIGANHINQCGDTKSNMKFVNEKDTSGNYKLKLFVSLDFFMGPSAQFSDYVLPSAYPLEVEGYTGQNSATYYIPKLIDPPGEAMHDLTIMEEILNSYEPGLGGKAITNNKSAAQLTKESFDAAYAGGRTQGMDFQTFKQVGIIDTDKSNDDLINPYMKKYRAYINGDTVNGAPLNTTSGKIEAYSAGLVEDYEARRWYNFDDDPSRYSVAAGELELVNIGQTGRDGVPVEGIYTKSCNYSNNKEDNPLTYTALDAYGLPCFSPVTVAPETNMKKARFVYPIPMYIPLTEGLHACDDKNQADYPANAGYPDISTMRHPDPLGLRTEYPLTVGNHHSIYRAHSVCDNTPLSNEVYKRDNEGYAAHRSMEAGKDSIQQGKGVTPAALGVYEPLDINPADAQALGLKTGDVILVTSPRAPALMSANVTGATRKGITRMAEGSWATFKDCMITFEDGSSGVHNADVAGASNTLGMGRISRIAQGAAYGSYQRIKIQKVRSVTLV